MAKQKKEKSGGMKGTGVLIIILIIISWLSIMALLIKCDVGGFGSGVLRPVLKDVPVIKWILPDASDEEVAKENDYPYDTLEEALTAVALLDQANASKEAEIAALTDKNSELAAEVARLSAIESEMETFEEEKNKFIDDIFEDMDLNEKEFEEDYEDDDEDDYDEEDYEDDNEYSPIMITQNNAPSNTILRSLNKSLDNISIVKYKKSNFYTSRNLITIKVKKNNSFEKIKEEFNDITKIYPYLSVRQKTDLSLKKLQLSRQKRNDDYFNSFVENDNDDDFIK